MATPVCIAISFTTTLVEVGTRVKLTDLLKICPHGRAVNSDSLRIEEHFQKLERLEKDIKTHPKE